MPPLCCDRPPCGKIEHDQLSQWDASYDGECLATTVAVKPSSIPISSSYDYPSNLNVSALKFESCWSSDEENDIASDCERERDSLNAVAGLSGFTYGGCTQLERGE